MEGVVDELMGSMGFGRWVVRALPECSENYVLLVLMANFFNSVLLVGENSIHASFMLRDV